MCGERPYLAVVENKPEISHNRLERTEGTRGVSHSTKQFGCGRRGGLAARFDGLVRKDNF